jgi:hypothetical protein
MVVVGIPPKKHVGKRAARLWIEDAYSHHLARDFMMVNYG